MAMVLVEINKAFFTLDFITKSWQRIQSHIKSHQVLKLASQFMH